MSTKEFEALDFSKSTAECCAALVAAQADARTVGKDGWNDFNSYAYATAEAMIRASRELFSKHGLALVVGHKVFAPAERCVVKVGTSTPCALVRISAAVVHSAGGFIRSTHEIHAIAQKGRPNDKAEMSALTQLHGFAIRSLLNLDRAVDPDDNDQRNDGSDQPVRPPTKPDGPSDDPIGDLREGMRLLGNTKGWAPDDIFQEAHVPMPEKGTKWVPTDAERAKLWGAVERLGKKAKS